MYKIFVGDKPIILSTEPKEKKGVKNYKLNKVILRNVIRKLNNTPLKKVYLVHKNEEKLLKKFLKKAPNVVAGGGKVYNDKGKVLFIFRNGKWDLPKGKIEKKESIEETAIREVEEETGVKGLEIVKPLETTYHIFKRRGRYRIKITYWFEMKTSFDGKLYPQEKEGITKVKWLGKKKIKKAMNNSYANIKILID
ncbi:NUDIX hydrolase [Jejuia pallidilutea]|jgi:8-oxo-dGTP pyrophosphatase MutT (NUDIX family)|uniref:ADP-ribose pyrophosphatase YjhB (NUDIX family) n=1 Tax=Jejuia pallidilutea TaxID=504487 RepID=A0A090W5X2_9FLAO|nr:NUDIX domain-containing protein [Jejuia pallidilutea]PQV45691.1 ADP-ribose pyrophosphatase YjhB (NUDIX family) [Jejuia pallidilutea]GAL68194.1 bis(5'-nucleosyl)-tetraphosphatase [Jejuia pallidilutea]GAL71623.1 bis(5'-nucleosyl)-tetraphosphatase [Jejuia pallidilutea]GAL89891.1 bis(5'-nucleosyl)-tetraphosphatase [Jejuia pallidilutea]